MATYGAFVSTVLFVLAARAVYGHAKEAALELGDHLTRLDDLVGTVHHVRINGEKIRVSSALTELPVASVLDRFEDECRTRAGGLAEEFEHLPEPARERVVRDPRTPTILGRPTFGVLREVDGDRRGLVACFVSDDAGGSRGAASRIGAFLTSGNLGELGNLRYVVAKKSTNGKTHVVTAWTDGPLELGRLFPNEGDVPGTDADDVPRPPRSRRILDAGIEGASHGVRIYDSSASAADVLATFDTDMPVRGWERTRAFEKDQDGARAYLREGRDVLVFTEVDAERRDHTIVTVLEMRAR
ncbi:MAG: hypothetical protein U0169_14780 [Polyangiaceae bacterium]